MIRISKSDYVLGIKCPNALWFKNFRKDLIPEKNDVVLSRGTSVGKLACDRFPGGVRITAKPWEEQALVQTKNAMDDGAPYIYEATFATETGEYCAVDVLKNNGDGTWSIIEVKSTTGLHDYHSLDVSFQRYVCEKVGVKISGAGVLTLNSRYVRRGDLDLQQLFELHCVDDLLQDLETVEKEVARLRAFLAGPEIGVAISKVKCAKFYECGYKYHCWKDVPQYSVFNAFRGKQADEIYEKYGVDLENVPSELYARQLHKGDIEAFLDNVQLLDAAALRSFMAELKYPLYFLDYESIQSAVPMFDNSRAYQQICFQFSLHVQRKPGVELEHYEYLHDVAGTDPRPGLLKKLVDVIGDTGSVVVYNRSFEEGANKAMAVDFPEYADALRAINERIVDLMLPFRQRMLYRPCQKGGYSIKQTLPAFVPDMSYDGLGIHNGSQASGEFMDFMLGQQAPDVTQKMMENLREYCGQDTLAMVRLLDVVRGFAQG